LKEFLKALVAGLGCTPLLAVALFIGGAFINQFVVIEIPPPPRWLFFSVALFPVFFGLYMRALVLKSTESHWLDRWRQARQQKLVGRGRLQFVEDVWLKTQLEQKKPDSPLVYLLDDPTVWGWVSLASFLPLAYICVWYAFLITTVG
jgi:hypothetical protein